MRSKIWIMTLAALMTSAVVVAGPSCTAGATEVQGVVQVGELVGYSASSPSFAAGETTGEALVWTEEIIAEGASYVAPHFGYFNLPEGARVVVRSPDGKRTWEYVGTGKGELGLKEGFWGIHINGDTAIVELYSRSDVQPEAVVVDGFARGYDPELLPGDAEAICGVDDSEWAKCYQDTVTEAYYTSRPVARLLINGTGACTGWLVGSQGHLMTNNHCIGSAADAANTDYELMAEGATCGTDCTGWMACPGTVVATSATLIRTNAALDYTMVELPTNPTPTYGFLQMRDRGTAIGERIYIPGHPQAWGKKIAVYSTHAQDTSGMCEVQSLTRPPCSGGPGDIGYYCDTQGGSSGSPVISECDNAVIALHHCAYCPNRGVPIQEIITDLGNDLPSNAISTSAWDCDDCGPGWCDGLQFCDKWGCYSSASNISRLFCCGYLDPREGLGSCYGLSYCTGPNYLGLCYIDTAIQSRVMCADEDMTVACKDLPADDNPTE